MVASLQTNRLDRNDRITLVNVYPPSGNRFLTGSCKTLWNGNFVIQFGSCQTQRTYFDGTAIGVDKDEVYSTDNVVQGRDIRAKPTAEVEEDFLAMLSKFENYRNHGPGEENLCFGDGHFTWQAMTNGCVSHK